MASKNQPKAPDTFAVEGAPVSSAEEHIEAVAGEYGEFVAVAPIDHDGVRAYNVGDPVPKSNVDRWGYLDRKLVARSSTVAGRAALDSAADNTVEQVRLP